MRDSKQDAAFVRDSITSAIKRCAKSREQVADEMSANLGVRVPERMITAFTAQSKEFHRWPAAFDIAFCEVVGNYSILRERVERAGFRMIGPEEQRLIDVGRAYIEKAKAEAVLAQAWRAEVVK